MPIGPLLDLYSKARLCHGHRWWSGDPSSFLWDEASYWKRVWILICVFLLVVMGFDRFRFGIVCVYFYGVSRCLLIYKKTRVGKLSRFVWSKASQVPCKHGDTGALQIALDWQVIFMKCAWTLAMYSHPKQKQHYLVPLLVSNIYIQRERVRESEIDR